MATGGVDLNESFLQLGFSIFFVKRGSWLEFVFTLLCRPRVKLKSTLVFGRGFVDRLGKSRWFPDTGV